jgi:hypothetical protein
VLKIYFDDVLIDNDYYTYLDNDYKFFDDNTNFRLGATACNTFKLSVDKSVVSSHPNEVKIDDGTSTFYLIVDSVEEDKFTYTYTLVDKLMLFNFYYDASEIIEEKASNEEDCYLSDILADICEKAGVELDPNYEFQNDIVVTWYDNRKQAREYLSYIAELQYGYAQINEDGKLTFKKHNSEPVKTINIDECSDLVLGEGKTISRVVFDNGIVKYEFGDDSGATLYLNPDNVYITNEEIVENIYNELAGFIFYNVSVPQCPVDSSVRAGDVIVFTDGVNEYPTIAQYSLIYNGGWTGGYSLSVNTEKQQETQIIGLNTKVRNIQSNMDYLNNEMTIIAEEIEGLTDFIRNVGTTGAYLQLPNTPNSNGAVNELNIKGFELTPLYPGMSYPSDYTYPGALSFYTLVFDNISTFDNNPYTVYINSPIALQQMSAGLNTHYDEIKIEKNKVKIIQRIAYDFDEEEYYVLSEPIEHELDDVIIPTFETSTFVKVLYFDNLIFSSEYIQKNDLTSQFATQLESSSQFRINQNEIEAKVNKDGIISSINLSPEEIKILANRIKLEGLVTANERFKILLDGSIEAVNAKLSGDIYLPDGGRVIGGDGILTNLQYAFNNYGWNFPDGSDMRSGYWFLGYNTSFFSSEGVWKNYLMADIYIPKNFTVTEAKIRLLHANVRWDNGSAQAWGYCRNLRVYKVLNASNFSIYGAYLSEYDDRLIWSKSEISGAFGSNGFTAPVANDFGLVEMESTDISSSLNTGNNKIIIQTANSPEAFTIDPDVAITRFGSHTGYVLAVINIKGYMSVDD